MFPRTGRATESLIFQCPTHTGRATESLIFNVPHTQGDLEKTWFFNVPTHREIYKKKPWFFNVLHTERVRQRLIFQCPHTHRMINKAWFFNVPTHVTRGELKKLIFSMSPHTERAKESPRQDLFFRRRRKNFFHLWANFTENSAS